MAQVVNVAPIELYRDEAMPRFIAALSTQIETKRKQEEAMRQAKLKQNEDNARLFGDAAQNIQKYSEIDVIIPAVSNRLAQQAVDRVYKSLSDGTAQTEVPLLGVTIAQQIGALKNYKTNVESARTRIKELYPGVSDENITALANKYLYRQIQNPDGTVIEDVNWNNLPNIQELILGEFRNNPSRYADLPALTNSISRTIGGIKTNPFAESRKTDPTGKRTLSLGVKAEVMPFELDIFEKTDSELNLPYRVPGIRVVPFAGFNKPDGTPYNVIGDNVFNSLIASSDKSLPNMLNVKADGMIVDHNTQVIFDRLKEIESKKKKGEPKFSDEQIIQFAREQAVGAGARESVELEGAFPGFVNKYLPSNIDAFVRIAATKALSDTGRYNPDGSLKSVQFPERGDVKDSPKIIINNMPSRQESTINAFDAVFGRTGGRASKLKDVAFGAEVEPFVEFANNYGKRSRLGMKYSANDIELVPNQSGTMSIVSRTTNAQTGKVETENIGTIDRRTVDMFMNKPLGQKAQQVIVEGENKTTGARDL